MEVTHYANSFISVKSQKSYIVCDPWLGDTNENAWNTYPITNHKKIKIENTKPDYIYISHLHCDHFDGRWFQDFADRISYC